MSHILLKDPFFKTNLDFYRADKKADTSLKYLIFESKATSYQNLNKLNNNGINFITIRRRGEKLIERINNIPKAQWKEVRIQTANGKGRTVKVFEETTKVKDYEGKLRQVYITGNGKIKPAIIITNDFDIPLNELARKYSRRWLIEKGISEQVDFFHLNRNSSGMVVAARCPFIESCIQVHEMDRGLFCTKSTKSLAKRKSPPP